MYKPHKGGYNEPLISITFPFAFALFFMNFEKRGNKKMTKFEKFYESLMNHETTARNGDMGYLVTVGELLENGGRDEFFRTVRKHKDGTFSISRNVYKGIEWDRSSRAYWAECFTDYCHGSPDLKKTTVVFIGFDF